MRPPRRPLAKRRRPRRRPRRNRCVLDTARAVRLVDCSHGLLQESEYETDSDEEVQAKPLFKPVFVSK